MGVSFERLVARMPDAERARHVAEVRALRLPANTPPWLDSGVRVARGEEVTILARGRVVVSAELGLSSRPRYALWTRVGGRGPIWSGTADTQTFRAPHDGSLELAVYQGEWSSRDGALATPAEAYAALTGELEVAILRWRAGARAGLEALRRAAPEEPLVAAELARLVAPIEPPRGWEYLWFLGQSETYRAIEVDGRPGVAAQLRDDVAILRRPADFELGPGRAVASDAAVRIPVVAYVGTATWASFHVDLVGSDMRMTGQPDSVPPLARVLMPDIEQHGYRAYPLVDHIADKISAIVQRYSGQDRPSTRFKDLVDLVAIVTEVSVSADLQTAAVKSEAERRAMPLPSSFDVPDRAIWERGYAAEAHRSLLPTAHSLDEALGVVRPFVEPLLAGTAAGRWDPKVGRWSG